MLNKLSVLIMVLVFLIGSISKSLLFLEFELHQDLIAATLCEKKEIPNNHCHGMCHLIKELNQQDERESEQGDGFQNKTELSAFNISSLEILFISDSKDFKFVSFLERNYSAFILMDLRPPIA